MSLHGFIATAPQLNFTGNGVARFYARVGVEHFRKETDGSLTKLEPTFHDTAMFKSTAERAYARLRVGDQFVASGYGNEYELHKNGRRRGAGWVRGLAGRSRHRAHATASTARSPTSPSSSHPACQSSTTGWVAVRL